MNASCGDAFNLSEVQILLAEDAHHPHVRKLFYDGLLEGQVHEGDTGADIEDLHAGYFNDDGDSAFWVACLGEQVVGMVGVQRQAENVAEIRRLRVDTAFRRRGVGSLLMEHAVRFCQVKGYLKVTLDVLLERGPAIALFEKAGFTLSRTRTAGPRKLLDFYLDLYREPGI